MRFLTALGRLLNRQGYDVVQANRSCEALDLIRNEPPFDVVLSDVTMPGTGGTGLVREIAQMSPHTACVLMTGGVMDPADVPKGVPLLRKPLSRRELAAVVEEAAVCSAWRVVRSKVRFREHPPAPDLSKINTGRDHGCTHSGTATDVYVRTFERVASGMEPDDVVIMCTECYATMHNHTDCTGSPHSLGCFHEGVGRTLADFLAFEREVCADIPFTRGWDSLQRERFRRLHNRQIQEQWSIRNLP